MMKHTTYNKLVRDKIPEIITQNGDTAKIHVADEAEYQAKLYEKLVEELAEFRLDPSATELADIQEVVKALAELHGLDLTEVERIRLQKAQERGGFTQRIILEETNSH